MTRETEAKWRDRVQAWRASGRSADAMAAEGGFAASTLRYWASRLKAAGASPAVAASQVAMARVVRRDVRSTPQRSKPLTGGAGELAVVVGRARIAVERGFDAELLRELVLALGGSK